jgi:hypothetical protein
LQVMPLLARVKIKTPEMTNAHVGPIRSFYNCSEEPNSVLMVKGMAKK